MIHIELRDPNIAQLFHHRIVIENIRALKFGNYVDITIIITSREGKVTRDSKLEEPLTLLRYLALVRCAMMILLLLFPNIRIF